MEAAEKYSVIIRRVIVDGTPMWRSTVKELPDLALYGDSPHEAHRIALEMVSDLQRAASEDKTPFPDPAEEDDEEYSGRVTLRMPPSLHARIASRADSERVSLNHFITLLLAAAANATTREIVWSVIPKCSAGWPLKIHEDNAIHGQSTGHEASARMLWDLVTNATKSINWSVRNASVESTDVDRDVASMFEALKQQPSKSAGAARSGDQRKGQRHLRAV